MPSAFLLRQFIRANKILKAVRKLNIRKDAVFETLMDRLEENGISMVDFHCLSIEESAYLEVFFDLRFCLFCHLQSWENASRFRFSKTARSMQSVCCRQRAEKKNSESCRAAERFFRNL